MPPLPKEKPLSKTKQAESLDKKAKNQASINSTTTQSSSQLTVSSSSESTTSSTNYKRKNASSDSSSNKKLKQADNDILKPFLPMIDGKVLNKTPPPPTNSESDNLNIAKAYLEYVQSLFDNFPDRFTDKRRSTFQSISDTMEEGTFQYDQQFITFIKNIGNHIAKSDEQRKRDNELEREKNANRREKGLCRCGQPVCSTNLDKCKECALKGAEQKKKRTKKV